MSCVLLWALLPLLPMHCAWLAPNTSEGEDAVAMVLSVTDNGTRFAWELEYGLARQMALERLAAGENQKALACAKMQFLLCPLESTSVDLAIESVEQMLTAVDGNDERAKAFAEYAQVGPAGGDGTRGTRDDIANPIASVALVEFERPRDHYTQYDKTIDDRAAVSATWEKAWYETEKAFERLNGADFDGAASILVATLAEEIKIPHANDDESWELQRIQDIIDRIEAGLGVVYRARTGTVAGVNDFVASCMEYAEYGPAGRDGKMGTADDLKAPL